MGSRTYNGYMDNAVIGTAVQDIFSLKTPAAKGAQLHHVSLTAGGVTTVAEIRMRLKRGTGTLGGSTGGTNVTTLPPADPGDTQASGCTFHYGDTTQATATAFVNLVPFQWNVLGPFDYMPGPEDGDREAIDVSSILILDLPAVIAASLTASGFMKWREYP
jgi:hypothetical protein